MRLIVQATVLLVQTKLKTFRRIRNGSVPSQVRWEELPGPRYDLANVPIIHPCIVVDRLNVYLIGGESSLI